MPQPKYPFTPIEAANRLLAQDGTALLIGLCLEQQVRSEKAMVGPFVLKERLGHLDPGKIAAMPPATLEAAFRAKPAIHRFPGLMAKRVQALCALIDREFAGDGARVWLRVTSASDLFARLRALPGFGDGKAASGVRILATFGKRRLEKWEGYATDGDMPWVYRDGKRVDR